MKEKERYELFGEHCIKDNNPDARCQLLNTYQVYVILNEQDKEIIKLRQENQQLKQQLAEKEEQIKRLEDFGEQKRKAIVRLQKNKTKINTEFAIQQLQRVREILVEKMKLATDKLNVAYEIDKIIKEIKGE